MKQKYEKCSKYSHSLSIITIRYTCDCDTCDKKQSIISIVSSNNKSYKILIIHLKNQIKMYLRNSLTTHTIIEIRSHTSLYFFAL